MDENQEFEVGDIFDQLNDRENFRAHKIRAFHSVIMWLHVNRKEWAISIADGGLAPTYPQVSLPDGTNVVFGIDPDDEDRPFAVRVLAEDSEPLTMRLERFIGMADQEILQFTGEPGDRSIETIVALIDKAIDVGPYLPSWPRTTDGGTRRYAYGV